MFSNFFPNLKTIKLEGRSPDFTSLLYLPIKLRQWFKFNKVSNMTKLTVAGTVLDLNQIPLLIQFNETFITKLKNLNNL